MHLGALLFLFSLGKAACAVPNVNCTIINLQYIDCVWNENRIPEFNYTFRSRLKSKADFKECPSYLQEGGHIVGCRLPYANGDKFQQLLSYLSLNNHSSGNEQAIPLLDRVRLSPPHNLSVEMQGSSELWLRWIVSTPSSCVGSEVSYRKDTDQQETMTGQLSGRSFSLPFPSESNQYTFKVRSRLMESCIQSQWSPWSTPVYWGQMKQSNGTGEEEYSGNSMAWLAVMLAVVCCAVVAVFVVFHNERLRIILIPVLPNPSKTLDELLYTYNGNVEEWLHISKDFVEGFKPNFSEQACPVREYSLIPQKRISGPEGSLPVLLEEECPSGWLCPPAPVFPSLVPQRALSPIEPPKVTGCRHTIPRDIAVSSLASECYKNVTCFTAATGSKPSNTKANYVYFPKAEEFTTGLGSFWLCGPVNLPSTSFLPLPPPVTWGWKFRGCNHHLSPARRSAPQGGSVHQLPSFRRWSLSMLCPLLSLPRSQAAGPKRHTIPRDIAIFPQLLVGETAVLKCLSGYPRLVKELKTAMPNLELDPAYCKMEGLVEGGLRTQGVCRDGNDVKLVTQGQQQRTGGILEGPRM
ncbi:hypothetical protein GJAV_G00130790 [Gymnothorax javanicus]|nr:hypothetical protein GJAV_G00130790 [Gymnothorax javanicus]